MICKSKQAAHVFFFLASTHTSDNYFKSPSSSQPRRGVHSWPAIQYCQRNLKFHPFQPPPFFPPPTLLPRFASKTLSALLTHGNTTVWSWIHTVHLDFKRTCKPIRRPVPTKTGNTALPQLHSFVVTQGSRASCLAWTEMNTLKRLKTRKTIFDIWLKAWKTSFLNQLLTMSFEGSNIHKQFCQSYNSLDASQEFLNFCFPPSITHLRPPIRVMWRQLCHCLLTLPNHLSI